MATQTLDTLVTFYTADLTGLASGTKRGAKMVDRFARQTAQSLKNMGAAWRRTGLLMTASITAPIVAGSVALIKLASDAEETRNKFNVVFSSIQADANAATNSLREGFGLSSMEAQKLLGDTADLLSGFGFTQSAALDLSSQVQTLAVDLASFTNVEGGAERASAALTKALLGERESVKELGIAILESDVKAKVLQLTQQGLTFDTERQAKAYATLQIALEQSKNAIGDFQRSSASFANQLRILRGRAIDLGVEFGTLLLPLAQKLVVGFGNLVDMFGRLTPEMRKNILAFALVAAAVGPLLIVLGLLLSSVGTLIGLGVAIVSWGATVAAALVVALPVIIALAAAVVAWWLALKDVIDLKAVLESFGKFLGELFEDTKDGFRALASFIRGDIESLGTIFDDFFGFIAGGIQILSIAWNGFALAVSASAAIITAAVGGIALSFAAMADFTGQKALAQSLRATAAASAFVLDEMVADVESRVETIDGLIAGMGDAPEVLKLKLKPVVDFFSNLPSVIDAAKQSVLDFLFVVPEIEMPELPGVPGADGEMAAIAAMEQPAPLGDVFPTDQIDEEAEKIKGIFDSVGGSMIDSFSSGFASVLQGTKSFGKMMKQVLGGAMNQLLTMFIKHTIEKLALSKVETVGNAVAAAKHPWLIPLFVGVALAAFSAALGGVGGSQYDQSGDGGAGGAGAAIPDVPIATPSGVVGGQSDVLASMDDSLGNAGGQTIVVRVDDEQGSALMSWMVRRTRDGIGDNTDRLALSSEVPA